MALRQFLFQATEGHHETSALTDSTQLAKISLTGESGIAVDAGNQRITALALTPTAASDAASKSYVDSVAAGFDPKESCRLATIAALPAYTPAGSGVGKTLTANANAKLTIDGVDVVATNRVLIKNEGGGTSAHNGIYVVTNAGADDPGGALWVLTRATDFDGSPSNEVTAGAFTFIEEGGTLSDSGWVLLTNNPITVDTTALTFTQFTGAGSITAGAGLDKTGSTLFVELDTAANAQGAGTGGGSSGLEFDTSGDAGKLRAAVNGTGGLERTASGLAVRIDDTPDTLDSGAAGLKVTGVPLQFKVNGVATSTTVTAANLDTLTNGSNADALHKHNKVKYTVTASGAISKGQGVYWSANNLASTGDCTVDAKSRIIGVADQNISDTSTGDIIITGECTGVLSGATFNTRYFLGSTGAPVVIGSVPSNSRTIQLGVAKNATDMFVQVFDYGKKAA
jgi:hypothetical protein